MNQHPIPLRSADPTFDKVTLPDGRELAYAEFGKPEGFPVLYFHGSPSSRLEPRLCGDDFFSPFNLRIIAPDRPGMGQSDFQPGRGFSDWPKDILALAEALGLEQFSVLGYSGGCGYAAACAVSIPERLRAVVIVSGAWRMDWPEAMHNLPPHLRLLWNLARRTPFLLSAMLTMMPHTFRVGREKMMAQQKKSLPPSDYAVMEQPGRMEAFIEMFSESMSQGAKGPVWDLRLYVREWDFDLEKIVLPLHLFHGEQDPQVPIALVRRMTGSLPSARLITYLEDGHLSTLTNHMEEIAAALTQSRT
jgi:pimeloyl-ACP methyl ester carboxylesterase